MGLLSSVWVYTQTQHPDGPITHTEYVSDTTAEHGEIVAALQVLYPGMVGCMIHPFDAVFPTEDDEETDDV